MLAMRMRVGLALTSFLVTAAGGCATSGSSMFPTMMTGQVPDSIRPHDEDCGQKSSGQSCQQQCDENDDAKACYAWFTGDDAPTDRRPNLREYAGNACIQGSAQACTTVAMNLLRASLRAHQGVEGASSSPENDRWGRALIDATCEGGYAPACLERDEHAIALSRGEDDWPRIFAAYANACNADVARGCLGVADLGYLGLGVTADPMRSMAMRERACELGSEVACASIRNRVLGGTLWKWVDWGRADMAYPDGKAISRALSGVQGIIRMQLSFCARGDGTVLPPKAVENESLAPASRKLQRLFVRAMHGWKFPGLAPDRPEDIVMCHRIRVSVRTGSSVGSCGAGGCRSL